MRQPDKQLHDRSLGAFVVLLIGALVFVYYTSGSLPKLVASHFDAAGVATGFLPRAVYLRITLALVLLPPIFLVLLPRQRLKNPNARINVPNQYYWLAPERRAETIDIIAHQCTRFAEMLLTFLCYGHWLIVRANTLTPPRWSTNWFLVGLVVFLGFTVLWVARLTARFRVIEE